MPKPNALLELREAHAALRAGDTGAAQAHLAAVAAEAPDAPHGRLAGLLSHALAGQWPAVAAAAAAWDGPSLQTVPALHAVALAAAEPSEESLRLALEAAWLPARPLVGSGDVPGHAEGDRAFGALWRLWEEQLAPRLLAELAAPAAETAAAEEAEPPEPAADPFRTALLALLDPRPGRAAHDLTAAVEAGLDLAPVRLALARLLRRAGERDAARATLRGLSDADLEAPFAQRLAAELEACARDAELLRAERVELTRGAARRELGRERNLYLVVREPTTSRRWARLVDRQPVGAALRDLVNDHLAGGWAVTDWTLAAEDQGLEQRFHDAMARGAFAQALPLGRRLLQTAPEDTALAAEVLGAALALRGPAGSLELSQRVLVLSGAPPWALRQHAALLYAAGAVDECLGTLFALEDAYGAEALSPAAFTLLAGCFVVPRFRPTLARELLGAGLSRFPDHPALREMEARLQLFENEPVAALRTLAPLLDTPRPAASVLAVALQALLEGELEGGEALARRARELHPRDPLLDALGKEVDGHAGAALKAHRAAVDGAAGPLQALEYQLYGLRAAYRLSAFEDGLRLARETQTLLGEPDPRCLDIIYECLTALEPGEVRDDLAEMADEARRRAAARPLSAQERTRALLSTGLHLDPAFLEAAWAEWAPPPTDGELPAGSPEPFEALLPVATAAGCVVLTDALGLADRLTSPPWDWMSDPALLAAEREAERLVVAPVPGTGPCWLRVTTREPRPVRRYRITQEATLRMPTGQLLAGPGEALLASPEADLAPTALAVELGGRFRWLPPGRYRVTVWHRDGEPWPVDELEGDPADVVFQLGPPDRR